VYQHHEGSEQHAQSFEVWIDVPHYPIDEVDVEELEDAKDAKYAEDAEEFDEVVVAGVSCI
jgi:hypothetical protein